MAHTYASNFIHCVFSTKDRRSLIPASRTAELYAYLGGIARGEGFSLIAAGGTANQFICCLSCRRLTLLPTRFKSSKAVRPDGWATVFRGRKDTEHSALVPHRFRS